MNKTFEKWLTIAALGGWVASMGALLAIEVASPQNTFDLSLSSGSQELHSYTRRSQFASVLDSQFYQQLKQSEAARTLEANRGHWLDHALISRDFLTQDFSGSEVKSQLSALSLSEETPIQSHKLMSSWMLAQIPEPWHQSLNK